MAGLFVLFGDGMSELMCQKAGRDAVLQSVNEVAIHHDAARAEVVRSEHAGTTITEERVGCQSRAPKFRRLEPES